MPFTYRLVILLSLFLPASRLFASEERLSPAAKSQRIFECDRCGRNNFTNGHALGGHKKYCGKPEYQTSKRKRAKPETKRARKKQQAETSTPEAAAPKSQAPCGADKTQHSDFKALIASTPGITGAEDEIQRMVVKEGLEGYLMTLHPTSAIALRCLHPLTEKKSK